MFHPDRVIDRDYYNITDIINVERKITPTVTYYRFTIIVTETCNFTVAKAGYTINYKPSNGGFVVSSYYYQIIATYAGLLKAHFCLPKADKDEVKAGEANFLPVKKRARDLFRQIRAEEICARKKIVSVEPLEIYSHIH